MGSQQTVGKVVGKVENVKEGERRKKQRQIGQVERSKSNQVYAQWVSLSHLAESIANFPNYSAKGSLICAHSWLAITLFLTGLPVNMTFYSPFAQMAN